MYRYNLLLKEINKNINVDERTNDVISNWSPNNVRRLILGVDNALVQYFVTGGKYPRLIERVDFTRVLPKDLELIRQNKKDYIGLFKALISGRICSSVEEIAVCVKGYPMELLELDTDFTLLTSKKSKIDFIEIQNRFKRLNNIVFVNCTVEELYPLVVETKKGTELLIDSINSKGILKDLVYEGRKDWWRGTYLRGSKYVMDKEGGVLDRYFTKIREELDEKERQEKLLDIEKREISELIDKEYRELDKLSGILLDNFNRMEEITKKVSYIDTLEWARFLSKQYIGKFIRVRYFRNSNSMCALNLEGLSSALKEKGLDDRNIIALMNFVYEYAVPENLILKTKLDLKETLHNIKILTVIILNMQLNALNLALTKFLLRSGRKYIEYHADKVPGVFNKLVYTRTCIEFLNDELKDEGLAKSCFDAIGGSLIKAEEFTIGVKLQNIDTIIKSLSGVGGV